MADDLTWLPAWRLRELIGAREVSPVEVVDHFLGRIDDLNPELKAFSYVDPAQARAAAKEAEEAVRRGDELGPLHGIPTALKEHAAVAGMRGIPSSGATAGLGLTPVVAKRDGFVAERLRGAGAVIVGLNTMMGSGATLGPTGGPTYNWDVEARNPWDTSKVPGWSSSGGAASVAAGLVPFAIGHDGGGSTRLPAAYSGVVGLHTHGGLIADVDYHNPTAPIGAPSNPQGSSYGPQTRGARDCALVLKVLAGPDGRDPLSLPYEPPDYLAHIDDGIDGWRFAWTDDFGFAAAYASEDSPRVIACVRAAAMGLASLGASVEATQETWEDPFASLRITSAAYGTPRPGAERPSAETLEAALEHRGRADAQFRRLFRDHELLLSPTAQRVARSVEEWNAAWSMGADGMDFSSTYTADTFMFNWLKYPAASVPCGFVDGLPVGLQIVGLPGREDLVLRAAQAFQQAFPQDGRPPVS